MTSRLSRSCTGQLNPDDPPVTGLGFVRVFEQMLAREGLDLLVLEVDDEIVGTTAPAAARPRTTKR
jgi:hypothetical protein